MSVFNVIYLFPLLVHKSVSAKAAPDAPDSPCKLYVFLHQGDPLGVYSAQLRVLKQMYHEGLCGFLQRLDGLALPSKLFARRTTIQSNFSNEAHKRQLQQQKLRVGLVLPDFPQCDSAGAVSSSLSRRQWVARLYIARSGAHFLRGSRGGLTRRHYGQSSECREVKRGET